MRVYSKVSGLSR